MTLFPDLVEDFAVELRLLPLVLRLRHLDHIPQQVEGQIDGKWRIVAPLQQLLRRRPQRFLLILHVVVSWWEQTQRHRFPPLGKLQNHVVEELRGGAVSGCSLEHFVQALVETAVAIQPAVKDARSAVSGAEVRREEDRVEEQLQGG